MPRCSGVSPNPVLASTSVGGHKAKALCPMDVWICHVTKLEPRPYPTLLCPGRSLSVAFWPETTAAALTYTTTTAALRF
jgi:hypothetical protein